MDEITNTLVELQKLLKQIFKDKQCDEKELKALSDWFDECAVTISATPFHQKINIMLDDGVFTKKEIKSLIKDIKRYIRH